VSHALEADEFRIGDFSLHDNGSVFRGYQHCAWITDDGIREFVTTLSNEELEQVTALAVIWDKPRGINRARIGAARYLSDMARNWASDIVEQEEKALAVLENARIFDHTSRKEITQ
jgi:hypothetical protein